MNNLDLLYSIADIIDSLSIENIKCYDANTKVLQERQKENPDPVMIANMELQARTAGEQRVRLKKYLLERIDDAIKSGGIQIKPEARTYAKFGV